MRPEHRPLALGLAAMGLSSTNGHLVLLRELVAVLCSNKPVVALVGIAGLAPLL